MSFLEYLDELRRRIIRAVAFVFVALVLCWFVSDRIYNFLAVPVPLQGLTGGERIIALEKVQEGDPGRFIVLPVGAVSFVAGVGLHRAGSLPARAQLECCDES